MTHRSGLLSLPARIALASHAAAAGDPCAVPGTLRLSARRRGRRRRDGRTSASAGASSPAQDRSRGQHARLPRRESVWLSLIRSPEPQASIKRPGRTGGADDAGWLDGDEPPLSLATTATTTTLLLSLLTVSTLSSLAAPARVSTQAPSNTDTRPPLDSPPRFARSKLVICASFWERVCAALFLPPRLDRAKAVLRPLSSTIPSLVSLSLSAPHSAQHRRSGAHLSIGSIGFLAALVDLSRHLALLGSPVADTERQWTSGSAALPKPRLVRKSRPIASPPAKPSPRRSFRPSARRHASPPSQRPPELDHARLTPASPR